MCLLTLPDYNVMNLTPGLVGNGGHGEENSDRRR